MFSALQLDIINPGEIRADKELNQDTWIKLVVSVVEVHCHDLNLLFFSQTVPFQYPDLIVLFLENDILSSY